MTATETVRTAIIGIDPGSSSGALCLYYSGCVFPVNMPDTMQDILRHLQAAVREYDKVYAILENVGGTRPGNAAKSARTFSEHVGALKMALIATEITTYKVVPRKWMNVTCGHGVPTGSQREQVKKRKDYIYARLQEQYPGVKFTKRQADAVGLMHYGRILEKQGELL